MRKTKDEIPADIQAMTFEELQKTWESQQNPTPERKAQFDAMIKRRDDAQDEIEAYAKRKFAIQTRYLELLSERAKATR